MDKIKPRQLLWKHLRLLGENPIRYNPSTYQAFLNALEEAISVTCCCAELKSKECPMCNKEKELDGFAVCKDCGDRSF